MTDKNFIETHTIGSDFLGSQLEDIEAAVASQVGQATHYLALGRSRDARIHLEHVMSTLRQRHTLLLERLFSDDQQAPTP